MRQLPSLRPVDWLLLITSLIIVFCNTIIVPTESTTNTPSSATTPNAKEKMMQIAKHQRMLHSAAVALEVQLAQLLTTITQLRSTHASNAQDDDGTLRQTLLQRSQHVIADTHTALLERISAVRDEVEQARKTTLSQA